MKKIVAILILIHGFVFHSLSQVNLNIQYTNGGLQSIPLTDIDSINYTVNTSNCPITVMDVDGNIYNVVAIGTQCWMKENFKAAHFNNGAVITVPINDAQWNVTVTAACADYNYDTTISNVYGKLYNYFAVADTQGLCPVGWHVSTDAEWNYVVKRYDPNADTNCVNCVQSPIVGAALKENGLGHWLSPNASATNISHLTLLPGGWRTGQGPFNNLHQYAHYWTSTKIPGSYPFARMLWYINSELIRGNGTNGKYGMSVRCVKD